MITLTHAEARRDLHTGRRWLDNKAAAALDAHLAACAECRAYAADLAVLEPALTRALHARWDNVQPPRPAPAEESASPRTRPRRLNPAFVMVAVALVLVLGVLLPAVLAPPLAATPGPATAAGVAGLPSPTSYADLDRALFAAYPGEFSGPPEATMVEAAPRVMAWDPLSDQVLWSAETGLWPRLVVDRAGRFVYVLSQHKAGATTLAGLTYNYDDASHPSDAWPLRVTVLDPANGATLYSMDLPPGRDWMNLIGAAGSRLYLYRFAKANSLYAVEPAANTLLSFSPAQADLCTAAYPRYVQLAPDGSAVYAFCTPNEEPARWWVQITRLDKEAAPIRIDLPQVGGVTRWGNGMLLSPDGARLYVADTLQGLLGEIDTARGVMVRTTQYKSLGRQGRYEALLTQTPDGRLLYLGATNGLEPDLVIWVVDTTTLEPVGSVDLAPAIPRALAVRLDKLYVATDQGIVDMLAGQQTGVSSALPASVMQLVPYRGEVPLAAAPPPIVPTGLDLLAFIRDNDIYVMYADGSGLRNLTQRPGPDRAPTWSPDGRYLAYIADRGNVSDVMLLDVEAALASNEPAAPISLLVFSASVTLSDRMAWSPDSRQLAVSFWPQKGPDTTGSVMQLIDVPAALAGNGRPSAPLPHRGSDPRFSPGGTRLLYLGSDEAGVPALFVEVLATGERLNLTAGQNASSEEFWVYNGHAWSPDGQSVAYLRTGPWLGEWPNVRLSRDSHAQIVIAAPDGSARTVVWDLAPAPNGIFGLEYSPDGRYLMFVSDRENNGCWNIHLVTVDDGTLTRLEGVCYTTRTALPHWSPDSRWLVFTAGWDGAVPGNGGVREQELTAIDVAQALFTLDHSQRFIPVRLTTWVGDDYSPQWRPECFSGRFNC